MSRIKLYDEQRRQEYITRTQAHIAFLTEELRAGRVPDDFLTVYTLHRNLLSKTRVPTFDLGSSLYGVWPHDSRTSRLALDQTGTLWFTRGTRLTKSEDYTTFHLTGSLFLEFRLSDVIFRLSETTS